MLPLVRLSVVGVALPVSERVPPLTVTVGEAWVSDPPIESVPPLAVIELPATLPPTVSEPALTETAPVPASELVTLAVPPVTDTVAPEIEFADNVPALLTGPATFPPTERAP